MSKSDKPQKITFKSIIRLIIFSLLVWLIISFLNQQSQSKQKSVDDPTLSIEETLGSDVLGEVYSHLPQDSQNQIENFDQSQMGIFFNNSLGYIKEKLDGFPQKQIKEIKKAVVKNISDEMIRQIDEK